MGIRVRYAMLFLAACVVLSAAFGDRGEAYRRDIRPVPLLDSIRSILRLTTPAIEEVAILEVRAGPMGDPRRALLAWGIRKDRHFQGSFAEELFGVFVVNDSLTRLIRTVDVIPTPRWLDFEMRLEGVTRDSIHVRGQGATHGDAPFSRAYAW